MADKTPEELAAEVERLQRENQSLNDRVRTRNAGDAGVAAENAQLKAALDLAKSELASVKQEVAAEKGPDEGTQVCYQDPGETFCRPAWILSDGFSARVPRGGSMDLHAHLAFGDPEWLTVDDRNGNPVHQKHTREVDAAWNPMGAPRTWHCLDECPRLSDKDRARSCPFADKAKQETEARQAKLAQHGQQAP